LNCDRWIIDLTVQEAFLEITAILFILVCVVLADIRMELKAL
jgi:hypothetical protein